MSCLRPLIRCVEGGQEKGGRDEGGRDEWGAKDMVRERAGMVRERAGAVSRVLTIHNPSTIRFVASFEKEPAPRDDPRTQALEGGTKAQFVTMGSGIEELEEVAADLEDKYPGNFRAVLSFKGAEKYKIYAAADFALMPSRFVGESLC